MAETAHVRSLDAIESFRTKLILYLSKTRPALEEVSSEVTRVRLWLENDQRIYWESQFRRRKKALEEAEQALFSARLTNLRETTDAELQAVHRAKRALNVAEEKLKTVKQWKREFEHRVLPLLKELEKMHTFLIHDMGQATVYLSQIINALQDYRASLDPKSLNQENR